MVEQKMKLRQQAISASYLGGLPCRSNQAMDRRPQKDHLRREYTGIPLGSLGVPIMEVMFSARKPTSPSQGQFSLGMQHPTASY